MGKSKETAPAPPNAQGLANTQFQANRDAAIESALLNQLDEFTPFGRKIYTGEIGTPDRTVTTALTPEGQAILDQRNKASMKRLRLLSPLPLTSQALALGHRSAKNHMTAPTTQLLPATSPALIERVTP